MLASSMVNLSANEKKMSDINNELSFALRKAMGYEHTIPSFSRKCNMPDPRILVDMYNGSLSMLPPRELLRTIAANSYKGIIPHTYLYEICGYDERDQEEDRTWATFTPERGEIYYIDLGWNNFDAEQNGRRPCVIISNDVGNDKAPILTISPITSKFKRQMPTHVKLTKEDGMKEESLIMIEQTRCISKRRMFYNGYPCIISKLSEDKITEVNNAIEIQFGLSDVMYNEGKAFEMVKKIKTLEYNIKVKKSKDLLDLFDEKLEEFINYCKKYKRNSDFVIEEYERLYRQYA